MLYSIDDVRKEIADNREYVLGEQYPLDLAHEFADSALPVYYSEIVSEWIELPSEFSNQFHDLRDSLPERVEDLMSIDLYLYYNSLYSQAIAELLDSVEGESI